MNFEDLEQSLGYSFQNKRLLQEALTHSSVSSSEDGIDSNQRLEFLGDAVLELIISEQLFEKNPSADEGSLTVARVRLVRGSHLSRLAKDLNLGKFLAMSEHARNDGTAENERVLEDSLEAIVGAVYLDGGLQMVRRLRDRLFGHEAFSIPSNLAIEENPKGALQELLQSMPERQTPVYEITGEKGPPHDRVFESFVRIGGKVCGRGTGTTKREAEAAAALKALETLAP